MNRESPINSHVYFGVVDVEDDEINIITQQSNITAVSIKNVEDSKSEEEEDEDSKSEEKVEEESRLEKNTFEVESKQEFTEAVTDGNDRNNLTEKVSRINKIKLFIIEYYLPLGFALALIVSLSYPLPGSTLASFGIYGISIVQAINNFSVFFVSGITLNTQAVIYAFRQYKAVSLGIFAILILTPCFSFGIIRIPYQISEFALGLAIFSSVPTTLGVGVAMTSASDGNVAIALFLTLVTNMIGVVFVPYFLDLLLSGSQILTFDPTKVFAQLIVTIIVPSALGFGLRQIKSVANWTNNHKKALSMFSSSNLICIMWQVLSSAAHILLAQPFLNIFVVIVSSFCLHIFTIILMYVLTDKRLIQLPASDRVAVVIMSSQKSAPVAVAVISYITSSTAEQGLLCLPALIGQMCQIFIGYLLVSKFRALIKNS